MPPKALALFSGGLDSLLAIKLLQMQGVEVEAVHLALPFTRSAGSDGLARVKAAAAQLGVVPHLIRPDEELAEILAAPRFGYGKNLNPCQDCRIYQLKKAAALMPELGAAYLVTGEVMGQRPMSQRREALAITDREAGLKGLVLRPLTALCLPVTIPEERGWVDRNRLLGISGRSRTEQERMARDWELSYSPPGGGCLLTYQDSARRYEAMRRTMNRVGLAFIPLIGLGRHFYPNRSAIIIVGRNQKENKSLAGWFRRCEPGCRLLKAENVPGPLTLVLAGAGPSELKAAAALTVRYADLPAGRGVVAMLTKAAEGGVIREKMKAEAAEAMEIEHWRA